MVWVTSRLAAVALWYSFVIDASVIVVKALDSEGPEMVRQLNALSRLTVALTAVTKVPTKEIWEAVHKTSA
jgi:hypothetical protein